MQRGYVTEIATLDSRERYRSGGTDRTGQCGRPNGAEKLECMPLEGPRVSGTKRRQRLFTICFVAASFVAMLGWLTGIGWAAISLLRMFL
jgi:hypothetical protein